jgi:hypothetical protein
VQLAVGPLRAPCRFRSNSAAALLPPNPRACSCRSTPVPLNTYNHSDGASAIGRQPQPLGADRGSPAAAA